MSRAIIILTLSYMLSQFYRAFLAVLAPALEADLGAMPDDLARASGLWFLIFALMQVPVGWALDIIGPRRTASTLLAIGGAGGAALFAMATQVWHIDAAMVLIGIGCSPVLMACYYILARNSRPAVFATYAGAVLGFGSLGNLAAALPMTLAAQALGWRGALAALAMITLAAALAILVLVRDPPSAEKSDGRRGSVLDLLRMPILWPLFALMFVNYAAAGGIRGLWIGPYLDDVYSASDTVIGTASLVMGLAMVIGNFVYGPMDRILGTRKWVALAGNLLGGTGCLILAAAPTAGIIQATLLMALVGFMGASFAVLIAHARSFIPAHLTGRGVTLMNLFGVGGVGVMQLITGRVFAASTGPAPPADAYAVTFLIYGAALFIGCAFYLFARDSVD